MRLRIFSVFDTKSVAYLPPFCTGEIGQATRVFSDMVSDVNHHFGKHPEDYMLFEIGMFDDSKGLVEPFGAPELVVSALSLLETAKQAPGSQRSFPGRPLAVAGDKR